MIFITVAPKINNFEGPLKRFHYCIEIDVTAMPLPDITIYHNGTRVLHYNSRTPNVTYNSHVQMRKFEVMSVTPWRVVGCLTFILPSHYDNGRYLLVVSNELGTASRNISVIFFSGTGEQFALRPVIYE